jgi:hypothetical protein
MDMASNWGVVRLKSPGWTGAFLSFGTPSVGQPALEQAAKECNGWTHADLKAEMWW